MKKSIPILAAISLACPIFSQPVYYDPAGNSGVGADLISLEAVDTLTSWDFRLCFSPNTLEASNFAFGLIMDTDLAGVPSPLSGYPSTPYFGDDLYIDFNSLLAPFARASVKTQETTLADAGEVLLTWGLDTLSFSIPRSFTTPTAGNAAFILLTGIPHEPSGFEVKQRLPDFMTTELRTTTIPEPGSYACLCSATVAAYVLTTRRRRSLQTG